MQFEENIEFVSHNISLLRVGYRVQVSQGALATPFRSQGALVTLFRSQGALATLFRFQGALATLFRSQGALTTAFRAIKPPVLYQNATRGYTTGFAYISNPTMTEGQPGDNSSRG